MASISYNPRERRLVVEGLCWPEDIAGIETAVGVYAEPDKLLVLDLTRVPAVPPAVASTIAAAVHSAERAGARVRVWTSLATATTATSAPPALV